MLTIVVTKGWYIQQININNAFLKRDLQEIVYMTQSIGFIDQHAPHHVCKLHKALYGLKQAPRAWFDKLKTVLLDWGFENSKFDISFFIHKFASKLLLLLVYVDDILIT